MPTGCNPKPRIPSRPRIRIHTAAAGTALALAGLAALAPPAAAQDGGEREPLALSVDGVHFGGDVELRLFDSLGTVVPGDTASASVWVRNDSRDRATLSVHLTDVATTDRELASAARFEVSAAGGNQTVTVGQAQEAGGRIRALDAFPLAPTEVTRVDVRLTIDERLGARGGEPGEAGTRESFTVGVEAALTEAVPTGVGPSEVGPMPVTGAGHGVIELVAIAALGALAGGAALARAALIGGRRTSTGPRS